MNNFSPFVKYLKFERNYSIHTVRSYQNDLTQYAQYLITHLDLPDILKASHVHVRSWIVHLMKGNYTTKSINRKLSTLKSFYKFCMKLSLISNNPATKVSGPKMSKRLPQVIKTRDMEQLINLIEEEGSFEALRDLMMINLLYQTGIRRDELINLKKEDINLSRSTIKVLGKGNKERLIPISPKLSRLILKYANEKKSRFDEENDFFLVSNKGSKMYPKFVYNTVCSWIGKVSTVTKRSPHVLRHSFATHLADNGAELNAIKELLGHASLAATEIYMHNTIERLKDVYGKAHPRAEKKR